MGTESGTKNPDVTRLWLEELFGDEPGRFDFFQAVRLLCRMDRDRIPPGEFGPLEREVVRFGSHHDPGFPPSQIRSLEWPALDAEGDAAPEQWRPPTMRVSFMGLTGPSGVLPAPYTEHVRERLLLGDPATEEFFDIFNHRVISLFYKAWEKYRFFVRFERDQNDKLTQYLLDLTGLGTPQLQNRLNLPDQTILFYSGLLSLLPRSALALEQALSDMFDVPACVKQFQGTWYPLNPSDLCVFSDPPTDAEQLGFGVVVGEAIYDRQSKARICLGPMPLDRYSDFLPGGVNHDPLKALAEFFSNGEITFDVQLILDRRSVPLCQLGMAEGGAPRLGWLTWMNSAKAREEDPSDTILVLN